MVHDSHARDGPSLVWICKFRFQNNPTQSVPTKCIYVVILNTKSRKIIKAALSNASWCMKRANSKKRHGKHWTSTSLTGDYQPRGWFQLTEIECWNSSENYPHGNCLVAEWSLRWSASLEQKKAKFYSKNTKFSRSFHREFLPQETCLKFQ